MFEAAETGRKLFRSEFEALEQELRTELLAAQFRVRDAGVPIVIIVSGLDGAGKGQVVDRLNEWLDTRGLEGRRAGAPVLRGVFRGGRGLEALVRGLIIWRASASTPTPAPGSTNA